MKTGHMIGLCSHLGAICAGANNDTQNSEDTSKIVAYNIVGIDREASNYCGCLNIGMEDSNENNKCNKHQRKAARLIPTQQNAVELIIGNARSKGLGSPYGRG